MRNGLVSTIVVAAALASAGPVRGLQNAPEAAALTGTWNLDSELTDRPEQIAAAVRADLAEGGGEQRFTGFEGGRGGRGRRGGPPPNSGQREQQSRQDQEQLDAITAPLRYPPTRLIIAQSGTAITLTDPQGTVRTLDTSGTRGKQTVGAATVDVTARFEGPQLVVQEDIGKGRTFTWTYSVLPATKQLLVRVTIARGPGEPGPFEIKHVYDRAPI